MNIIRIEETDSTNSWLTRNRGIEAPAFVYALAQTSGRGQRGNSWEAEPGMNLTASFLFEPEGLKASEQFIISEAAALAVTELLQKLGVEAGIKWPNDIYVGDKKIAGILIENNVTENQLSRSIIGIGLNVNQKEFHSDAPNPISVFQLTGSEHPVDDIARELAKTLEAKLSKIAEPEKVYEEYLSKLWRYDGNRHPFRDTKNGEIFHASIENVEPAGPIVLKTSDGKTAKYYFKEIEFLFD